MTIHSDVTFYHKYKKYCCYRRHGEANEIRHKFRKLGGWVHIVFFTTKAAEAQRVNFKLTLNLVQTSTHPFCVAFSVLFEDVYGRMLGLMEKDIGPPLCISLSAMLSVLIFFP